MANGREPDCAVCANCRVVHETPSIRDPQAKIVCDLHQVRLPYSQTNDLLICRDWTDRKTRDRLVDWPTQARYKAGILYAYPSIYAPALVEFREFSQLQKTEV